jgi:hypothetical protein
MTLLIALPKAFAFTIKPDLYATLLTVSLAWLALYIVGWLDPKGLSQVSAMTGVTGTIRNLGGG